MKSLVILSRSARLAFLTCSVFLRGQDTVSDGISRRMQAVDKDNLESKLRETRHQANSAMAMAAQALDEVKKQGTQPIVVPGETPNQAAVRHQEICHQIDQAAATAYAKEHPFLPTGFQPLVDPQVYAEAIRQSDQRGLEAAQAKAQAQLATFSARIAVLERKLAEREKPPPDFAQPQSEETSYNRQYSASLGKAIELYDFAADPKSEGGKRMIEIDLALRANGDPLYADPNKPLIIAQMVAKEKRISPKLKKLTAAKP